MRAAQRFALVKVEKSTTVCVSALEHKTCDISAAERLRLMRFDNRLIIESFLNMYTQI